VKLYTRKILKANPSPKACEKGPGRAITAYQLFDLLDGFIEFICDRNLYYIDANIVRPLTKPFRLSMAEFLGPSQVQWFVSHYWGCKFAYTCKALEKHAIDSSGSDWKANAYWICAFSNNQYDIINELGPTHEESAFYLSLHSGHVKATCMIIDELALPLQRSWCLFELLQTINLEEVQPGFSGLKFCTDTGIVNRGQATTDVAINIGKRLSKLSLENATATTKADKEMINSLVLEKMGSFKSIDNLLRQKIRASLEVCRAHVNKDFEELFRSLEGDAKAEPQSQDSVREL
jgi:hypothetical protein